ncbi:MAG TPA: OmpA family protein [Bacteroidales bacterium]|nr:OmpA family protein [Bacteroidales bacterium]
MAYRLTLFIIFTTIITLNIKGQFSYIPEEMFADANDFIVSEEYREALALFQRLQADGYDNPNITYLEAICFLHIPGQQERAVASFEEAVNHIVSDYKQNDIKETGVPNVAKFYLGVAYRLDERISEALDIFDQLKNKWPAGDNLMHQKINREINICKTARKMIEHPVLCNFKNAGALVNTPYNNFNPVTTPDEKELYYMSELKFYDAFLNSHKSDGAWTEGKNLTSTIKSDGTFYITGISSDGKTLLFHSYTMFTGEDIYQSVLRDCKWSEPVKLDSTINTGYIENHASLSPDGNVLYFTSSKPGGYGGLDIYSSRKDKNGHWSVPVNLGAGVNTPFDDITPFVSPDGKRLFFASTGHDNMGGFDLFTAQKDSTGAWSNPVNLGYPVNTTGDNDFFSPVNDTAGYICAYRDDSYGKADIYRVTIQDLLRKGIVPVTVTVQQKNISGVSEQAIVFLVSIKNRDTIQPENIRENMYFFRIPEGNYMLHAESDHFQPLEQKFTISQTGDNDLLVSLSPQRRYIPELTERTIPEADSSISTLIKLPGIILFPFDHTGLSKTAVNKLDSIANIMKNYPELMITITGKADARGPAVYNQYLSEQRAQTVNNYIKNKGINPQRIRVEATGEEHPLAKNQHPDGTDNIEGRRWNRSVLIKATDGSPSVIIFREPAIPERLQPEDK